jgi:hypothetical protein
MNSDIFLDDADIFVMDFNDLATQFTCVSSDAWLHSRTYRSKAIWIA